MTPPNRDAPNRQPPTLHLHAQLSVIPGLCRRILDSLWCNPRIATQPHDWLALVMKTLLWTASGLLVLAGSAFAQKTNSAASGVNLALVAAPSSSYVSGDTRNTALNDGYTPRSSRDSPNRSA